MSISSCPRPPARTSAIGDAIGRGTTPLAPHASLDAHLYGVDAMPTPDDPVVVDVNEFPGYRRVENAANLLAADRAESHG